ncbi:regulatory protein, luxR family [Propionibacterium cyclohexanicum]|uniref:Regulatory protein, luxR family n=2 Tax=Propionibacterium cyclohexanicum TaxID=64702 RepID=A0A1H9SJS2_9ACTN|nr:regulatory protein, luxR family [Propionibacterium cyclohexanicum]
MPTLPVLMLTQLIEPTVVSELIADSAPGFGYLLKDRVLDTETFLERIEVVGAGGTAIDPAVIDAHAGVIGLKGSLTPREAEVIRLVTSGRSNAGIASQLVISRRTVDAHLQAIFITLDIAAASDDNARVLAVRRWLDDFGSFRE